MKLRRIETTPNPNCMMLKVDEDFGNRPMTIDAGDSNLDQAPELAQALLTIGGVRSVFLSRDFITLTRRGNADWKPILASAAQLLGEAQNGPTAGSSAQPESEVRTGEPDRVEIAVLEFRGLPSQVRVTGGQRQARAALPERFAEALARVLGSVDANYLKERSWRSLEPRCGDPGEVAQMVADEIDSRTSNDDLSRCAAVAIAGTAPESSARAQRSQEDLLADLSNSDWKVRLAAIQVVQIDDASFPAIVTALGDGKPAVRRWAAAALGSSQRADAVAPLCQMVVSDASVLVRRAAGDGLSDLGDPAAIPAMCRALADTSHLVRWRAARFLNEQGDDSAVEALGAAIEAEADFGVRMEMTAASERIRGGGESQVPMWLRIARGSGPE